jgi:hypothetical protein
MRWRGKQKKNSRRKEVEGRKKYNDALFDWCGVGCLKIHLSDGPIDNIWLAETGGPLSNGQILPLKCAIHTHTQV